MTTSMDSTGKYKRVLSVLFRLTKKVNEGGALADLLKMVAEAATELTDADSCSIMLLDDAGQ